MMIRLILTGLSSIRSAQLNKAKMVVLYKPIDDENIKSRSTISSASKTANSANKQSLRLFRNCSDSRLITRNKNRLGSCRLKQSRLLDSNLISMTSSSIRRRAQGMKQLLRLIVATSPCKLRFATIHSLLSRAPPFTQFTQVSCSHLYPRLPHC